MAASVSRSDHLGSAAATVTYPRSARLLNRADFDHVFKHRSGNARARGLLCLIAKGRTGQPRIGFAISKKHLGRAVARNRLKRLLREHFRQVRADLPPVDLVILSQREVSDLPREQWPELCSQLFTRIIARSDSQT